MGLQREYPRSGGLPPLGGRSLDVLGLGLPPDDPTLTRLFCDAGHERLQALTRVAVSLVVAIVLISFGLFRGGTALNLVLGVAAAGYAALAALYHAILEHLGADREQRWVWRQLVVIAADLVMVGAASWLLGPTGLGLYPVLLWVIIGNGVCFGPRHLGRATLVGVPIFALAHWANGVALELPGVYLGLLGGLIVLPGFMQRTLVRMVETNLALRQQKEHAEHMALHDTLTDLPNRHLLLQRMDHAISRARRTGAKLAVLFMDLDGFKRVNDTQGHDAGDELLVQLAECLARSVREVDTLSRLGGDEFILLIEDYGSAADLNMIIERLFGCARRFYRVKDNDSYVTWSCGIAVYPRDGGDSSTLLRHADIAMYRAKGRGGDCAVHYDPAMSRQVLRELTLRTELRRAIDNGEFMIYYQPLVDARTGTVVAIEALVRWSHPGRGLLAPDEFLSVALTSGLMAEVDAQVLVQGLTDLGTLRRDGATDLRLAVNITARQLATPDFAIRLAELLARNALTADVLDLENTEAALLEETDNNRDLIRALRRRGVRFVLDDFGTGFSSLAHLRRFDIDQVKIDHSFVRGLPGDGSDAAMVEGILAIAIRLGLVVAAEGVETDAQRDWLLERGCVLQQGFYYGGPLPLSALRLYLGLPDAPAESGTA